MQERLSKLGYDLGMIRKMAPYAAINYIRFGVGYEEFLEKYAQERRLERDDLFEVVGELQESAQGFKTFQEWFDHINQYTEKLKSQKRKQQEEKTDCLSLATMHHSKGLEYKVVFIVDANEGIVPHQKALLDTDIEEERRMFYVAMTRAKQHLHIYFLKERYGKTLSMSRFVGEILVPTDEVKEGTWILHKTYGKGQVKENNGKAITIRFEKGGLVKKLDLQFCIANHMIEVSP